MKPSSLFITLLLFFSFSSSFTSSLQVPSLSQDFGILSSLSNNFLFKLSMSSLHKQQQQPKQTPLPIPPNITPDKLQPIVIVPALMNSNLYVSLSDASKPHWYCPKNTDGQPDLLWMDLTKLYIPGYFQCWAARLTLSYDPESKEYSSPPGVTISVQNYGNSTQDILFLDPKKAYGPMWSEVVGALEAIGYQVGENLFTAPYDFRLGPDAFEPQFVALQKLIELAYHQNGGRPVVLISLSMGCPYTNLFLTSFVSQDWKDQYISSFVSYSGVYAGSTIAMATLLNGANMADQVKSAAEVDAVLQLARSWGSVSWMTPQAEYFNGTLLVSTPQRNYTVNQIQELLQDAGLSKVSEIHSSVSQFITVRDPGVKTYCYYGYNLSTWDAIVFNQTTNLNLTTSEPTYTESDGDGTAVTASLAACASWANVEVIPVANMCHACFMYDPATLQELQQIVTGNYESSTANS